MRFKRRWTWVLLLVLVLLVGGCKVQELVSYGLMQGRGQLKVVWGAKSLDYWLEEGDLEDAKKDKLRLVQEIRRFAFDSLGLTPNKNYTKMYNDEENPALWLVSASEPYALEPMTWSFPLIGTFSYKGFFDKERALNLVEELKGQGKDVSMRAVGGWSTLGWFRDPVMASMLRRSEGDLANLIIHELTHATIFVKNDTELNENIATFVGDRGAEMFLAYRYGKDSEELKQYLEAKDDYTTFSLYWLEQALKLDSAYQAWADWPDTQRELAKDALISSMVEGLAEVAFIDPERYANYFAQNPNNNFFINFRRYRSKQRLFDEEFEQAFNNDLPAIISHWKKLY